MTGKYDASLRQCRKQQQKRHQSNKKVNEKWLFFFFFCCGEMHCAFDMDITCHQLIGVGVLFFLLDFKSFLVSSRQKYKSKGLATTAMMVSSKYILYIFLASDFNMHRGVSEWVRSFFVVVVPMVYSCRLIFLLFFSVLIGFCLFQLDYSVKSYAFFNTPYFDSFQPRTLLLCILFLFLQFLFILYCCCRCCWFFLFGMYCCCFT